MQNTRGAPLFLVCLFAIVLGSRLCHSGILWADEDYHQAAAIQLLYGKALYRDVWYDKPPLNAVFYLLFNARGGWVLRLAGALFVTGVCALAFRFASELWTRREGVLAAGLLAFFLIFYLPGAIIPLEPDTLMIAPHLAAVYLAWRRKPFAAGMASGLAFLINTKGLFVLASCLLFGFVRPASLVAGFLAPNLIFLGWLAWQGALADYCQQVWKWGILYAGTSSFGAGRVLGWMGFHAALVAGAAWCWWKDRAPERVRLVLWAAISFLAAVPGGQFFPRYFNQLLPALVISAARGISLIGFRPAVAQAALAIALAVPVIRFGPRYFVLAKERITGAPQQWKDIEMDQDSRAVALMIRGLARKGDTIFIWGYRPNIVAYTRLPIASRFWDSQPLTGVPADRHLSDARPVAEEWARANRAELIRTSPTFLVDGLSSYNPGLDIHKYADLKPWLAKYSVAGRTRTTVIYRLRSD